MGIIELLLRRGKDPLFQAAVNSLKSVEYKLIPFRGDDVDLRRWKPIDINKPNSPSIMSLDGDEIIIHFPEFSEPYRHTLEDKCKYCEIRIGELYDKASGKRFKKGDRFVIKPGEIYIPYTKDKECYALVRVGKCRKGC